MRGWKGTSGRPLLSDQGFLLAGTLLAHDFSVLARRLGDAPMALLVMALLLGIVTIPQMAWATPISIPHVFLNGTVADAGEVNQNFNILVLESNAQDLRITGLESTDITSVVAGQGLLGGGDSGVVNLDVDSNVVQSRVIGTCPPGSSIRAINLNGTVVCEPDDLGLGDITSLTAGAGLTGGGSSGDVAVAIATSGVSNSHLAPDSVDASKIATGAVGTLEVLDGSLGDVDLATSIAGSGTATVETTIRRFFIHELNGVIDGRIQIVCNGESQGGEATIRVYRNGALFDTYLCPGSGARPWAYFSPRFSIPPSGSIDVTYQLTSPGRFYWREVALEGDHPEPISVSAQDNTVDYLTASCASVTGTISIDAPGPGTVIVNANTWLRVAHSAGAQDATVMVLSETDGADCNDWQHTRIYTIPSGYPSTLAGDIQTIEVRRVFDVTSAATHTYYLNAYQSSGFGSLTDNIWWVGMQATFIPD